MPIYEFACEGCPQTMEVFSHTVMTENETLRCSNPFCGGTMRRLFPKSRFNRKKGSLGNPKMPDEEPGYLEKALGIKLCKS